MPARHFARAGSVSEGLVPARHFARAGSVSEGLVPARALCEGWGQSVRA